MAFLIRSVTLAADGREIVRANRREGIIGIGRAADNAIALPDLAVDPRHATVEEIVPGRIVVTALGTLGFKIDGRVEMRAEIDAAKGAELEFGGHRIAVTRADDGDVVMTVERVGAVSDTERDREEAVAFSLSGRMPGKRATAWLLVAAVLIGFLVWPIWNYAHRGQESIYAGQADKSWSSGPLSEAHHSLEVKCESCHVKAFVAVQDSACQSCHKDVHDHAPPARIANARAVPGPGGLFLASVAHAFGKPGAGSCVDCHTEHEGAGPMPATPQAFCADCHTSLKSRLSDTKLADAGDFGTSHPQFMPVVAVAPGDKPTLQRVSLDKTVAEQNGLKFPHKLHLDAMSGVSKMAMTLGRYGKPLQCADCHCATADGSRFEPVEMERDCQSCHSLGFDRVGGTVRTLRHGDVAQMTADLRAVYRDGGPSLSPVLGGMARRRPGQFGETGVYRARFGGADAAISQVFSRGGACYDCHIVRPPGVMGASDWSVTPVYQPTRYMQHGWFDHDAHKTEKCESCHAARSSASASDLLLPKIGALGDKAGTCRSCHGGEGSRTPVPSSCAMCHSYHVSPGSAPWSNRRRSPSGVARRENAPPAAAGQ